MSVLLITRRRALAGLAPMGFVTLAACAGMESLPHEPEIVHDNKPYRPAEPDGFAPILNAYRAQNGLSPVSVDATLNSIAQTYARHLAEADQMTHELAPYGGLQKRLGDGGYAYSSAAENLGEGYRDQQAAFEGWKRSPAHDRNMKIPEVTSFGIGSGFRKDSRYQAFWCLILGKPRAAGVHREGPYAGVQWGEPVPAKPAAPAQSDTFTINGMKWPF
ncbi:MAG: CAP domain-containing protein [Ancalomicrobiaceae bacterium]|nr:CAP domain-containing protein [Ancalomicrobiaceae bacterium]